MKKLTLFPALLLCTLFLFNGCVKSYMANRYDTMETGEKDETLNIVEDNNPSTIDLPWNSEYTTLELNEVHELETVETENKISVNDSLVPAHVHKIELDEGTYGIELQSIINTKFDSRNLNILFPNVAIYDFNGNKSNIDIIDFYRASYANNPTLLSFNYLTSRFRIAGLYKLDIETPGDYYIVMHADFDSNERVYTKSESGFFVVNPMHYYALPADHAKDYHIAVAPWAVFEEEDAQDEQTAN